MHVLDGGCYYLDVIESIERESATPPPGASRWCYVMIIALGCLIVNIVVGGAVTSRSWCKRLKSQAHFWHVNPVIY